MAKFPQIRVDASSVVVVAAAIGAISLISTGNPQPRALLGTAPATAQQPQVPSSPSVVGRRIIATMQAKGYVIDPVLNIVGVSGMNLDGTTNDNRLGPWNDLIVVAKPNGDVMHIARGTTEPDPHFVQKTINRLGAAFLAFGQYRDAYQIGIHSGLSGSSNAHEALIQVAPIMVNRDSNGNGIRDAKDLVLSQGPREAGLNWHRASPDGPLPAISRYSAGCVVTNDPREFRHFLQVIKSHPGYQQNRLYRYTVTLLNGQEVKP